jgi:rSAM/selenodomain-associated transferase 1
MSTLIVIAKAPVPGRVKTRLTPPFTPVQAARLARSALEDTLHAVAAADATAKLLVLDGRPDSAWLPAGFLIVPQVSGTLDRRLNAAFETAAHADPGPVLLVGIDTPQITPGLLDACLPTDDGTGAGHDAVFGPASDGGFWTLGFRRPREVRLDDLLVGVPMSTAETGAFQLRRLREAGLRTRILPELRDVDTAADAEEVAALQPGGRFAATLRSMTATALPVGVGR